MCRFEVEVRLAGLVLIAIVAEIIASHPIWEFIQRMRRFSGSSNVTPVTMAEATVGRRGEIRNSKTECYGDLRP